MIMETAFGIQLDYKQKEDLLSANIGDFQKMLSEIFREKRAIDLNDENKYRTIPESQLEEYFNKGFELVQFYPAGDKAIVKLPRLSLLQAFIHSQYGRPYLSGKLLFLKTEDQVHRLPWC